ncbi:Lrp/AsnC family transcriptional regulator [Taklimakanibacter deserti]|jgi:Lrp/AsnC family transcriptional regulator, leucine-responsive regulatory protein|uniref:Lrp/AsnC family transcriptional regulator n=1 Tax=Taklimakanibacter deserti TaxID=2267839 RepID=UPI000E659095
MKNNRRIAGANLDPVDRQLLATLTDNARISLADLGRVLGMSPQSAADRLRRLEDVGVIQGFTARLDPAALGLAVGAYIRVRPAMGELPRVTALLADIPEIIECDRITGEDCFMAKVFVARIEDLERVIDRLIPYAQTNTSIIQSSPVMRRAPKYS